MRPGRPLKRDLSAAESVARDAFDYRILSSTPKPWPLVRIPTTAATSSANGRKSCHAITQAPLTRFGPFCDRVSRWPMKHGQNANKEGAEEHCKNESLRAALGRLKQKKYHFPLPLGEGRERD